MQDNGFFQRMCKEATDELASGRKSWREIDTNTLFLACFDMLATHLTAKLSKPLWFFAGSIASAVLGYLVSLILAGGAR